MGNRRAQIARARSAAKANAGATQGKASAGATKGSKRKVTQASLNASFAQRLMKPAAETKIRRGPEQVLLREATRKEQMAWVLKKFQNAFVYWSMAKANGAIGLMSASVREAGAEELIKNLKGFIHHNMARFRLKGGDNGGMIVQIDPSTLCEGDAAIARTDGERGELLKDACRGEFEITIPPQNATLLAATKHSRTGRGARDFTTFVQDYQKADIAGKALFTEIPWAALETIIEQAAGEWLGKDSKYIQLAFVDGEEDPANSEAEETADEEELKTRFMFILLGILQGFAEAKAQHISDMMKTSGKRLLTGEIHKMASTCMRSHGTVTMNISQHNDSGSANDDNSGDENSGDDEAELLYFPRTSELIRGDGSIYIDRKAQSDPESPSSGGS